MSSTLQKTLIFVCIVESLKNSRHRILWHNPVRPFSIRYEGKKITFQELSSLLYACTPLTIQTELYELYLISVQTENYFRILKIYAMQIDKCISEISEFWEMNLEDIKIHLSSDDYENCNRIREFFEESYNNINQILNELREMTGLPEELPELPSGKPHFNRFPLSPEEPLKLHNLLKKYQLIPHQTTPETISYNFYGIGPPKNWKPVKWLKTVAELSYFIDMFFTLSDQNSKWKIAHQCFIDTNNKKFNYNSLRGKQYNYKSNRKSEILQVIDLIRNAIK